VVSTLPDLGCRKQVKTGKSAWLGNRKETQLQTQVKFFTGPSERESEGQLTDRPGKEAAIESNVKRDQSCF